MLKIVMPLDSVMLKAYIIGMSFVRGHGTDIGELELIQTENHDEKPGHSNPAQTNQPSPGQ